MNNIRNFCIISHIDHGKSTLADRLLEITGTIPKEKMREQYLDMMSLERERGITIKMQPVRMKYRRTTQNSTRDYAEFLRSSASASETSSVPRSSAQVEHYVLNLIDTPGHVDFSYEVSRALAAVEGAILLVDATKGTQAQTLANLRLAKKQGLVIVPAVNKIDLSSAKISEVKEELAQLLGISHSGILEISAKTGVGIEDFLDKVIEKTPSPKINSENRLRALVFDSVYDIYKGIIAYIRVFDGDVKKGDKIQMFYSGAKTEALEVGIFSPEFKPVEKLQAGEIGYVATGIKDPELVRVGETIILANLHKSSFANIRESKLAKISDIQPLAGYQEPKPMVFASFYPAGEGDYDLLKDALQKLKLNDSSLFYEPESSLALGRGLKCGFLGTLHLEIVSERLKREYNLDLIITSPSVLYYIKKKSGLEEKISSAQEFPDLSEIQEMKEPWVKLEIITDQNYFGAIMELLKTTRGLYLDTEYLGKSTLVIKYEVPLSEIIIDFYDTLKSISQGYASMNYEPFDYRIADLVKLDILVAGDKVEPFSKIVPEKRAYVEGRALVDRLKEVLPRQNFAVALQAIIGGKIIARETIGSLRKDVTAKLYGGDYTRKRKLLEKQKKGKKRLKQFGRVEIPQNVFLEVLKKPH